MSLCCNNDERREAVRTLQGWNGMDYVEVEPDQRSLRVYFLGRLPPELATNEPGIERHLSLEGGERVTGISITDVDPVQSDDSTKDDVLLVRLDKAGDFSPYTLRLVGVENVDPRYESVTFSFKLDCGSELDCAPACACVPESPAAPAISYLAKDYGSFRQLALDRMALLVPDWKERHVPDLGVTLVELLAYAGDMLSYYQDAVATEAYLDTARQRISVRRHLRLIDYRLHEGCNARAFVALTTQSTLELTADEVSFVTGFDDALADARTLLSWDDLAEVPASSYEVFEPLDRQAPVRVRPAHNEIRFHAWGRTECCLEKGATSAALLDTGLELAAGDVLVFEEVIGPATGLAADANPAHRHAVRLTKVTPGEDPIVRGDDGEPTGYVEVEWADEDALPFTFCVSAITAPPACRLVENVSVARGNVVLVDHGRTREPAELGSVPAETSESECLCPGRASDVATVPGEFRPALARAPLTFRASLAEGAPAALALAQDPRKALPCLQLTSDGGTAWAPRYDLLDSWADDAHFVVEIDNLGAAHLRFGDGTLGMQPPSGASFSAVYRTGNGTAGNVGAESISRIVLGKGSLSGSGLTARNPLPASGGIDAEPAAEAKLLAPQAFRSEIQRAIVAADYEELAERNSRVQKASAELVWTGSWFEADVAVDPYASADADAVRAAVAWDLEGFRRMGHDLHVEPAVAVPLDLELDVCALPGYQRAHVRAALLDVFSNRRLKDGQKGFFHPDVLTFGEGLALSVIVAKAQAVPGVECATVSRFQRLFAAPNKELENGWLPLGRHEIAQLDNDPNHPEHGRLVIVVRGGR